MHAHDDETADLWRRALGSVLADRIVEILETDGPVRHRFILPEDVEAEMARVRHRDLRAGRC